MTTIDPAAVEDFARRYTAAWCSHDPRRVAAHFVADGSLQVNDGPPAIGHPAIAEVAQGFFVAFPDMQVLMDGVERQGDRFLYHWTLVGTNNGPGGTGRAVRISGHESWRLGGDGLIVESLGHFDAEDYQRQLTGA
jgi:uncharacterized protein (TIGR02246 family)